ncbi:unnamed protein product [Spirodela intermedia]|uniref:Uncharacterized protein n=1 Tax=Spirodela intermedia TaxID=51605 RepID=A0A7I8IQU0_SPIIN|nr:unnamed protein product [Spirodela intermedia]CAA6659371.1 unnamed protein product [Spirodela intermedia]
MGLAASLEGFECGGCDYVRPPHPSPGGHSSSPLHFIGRVQTWASPKPRQPHACHRFSLGV